MLEVCVNLHIIFDSDSEGFTFKFFFTNHPGEEFIALSGSSGQRHLITVVVRSFSTLGDFTTLFRIDVDGQRVFHLSEVSNDQHITSDFVRQFDSFTVDSEVNKLITRIFSVGQSNQVTIEVRTYLNDFSGTSNIVEVDGHIIFNLFEVSNNLHITSDFVRQFNSLVVDGEVHELIARSDFADSQDFCGKSSTFFIAASTSDGSDTSRIHIDSNGVHGRRNQFEGGVDGDISSRHREAKSFHDVDGGFTSGAGQCSKLVSFSGFDGQSDGLTSHRLGS